jgi:hypothetical protein
MQMLPSFRQREARGGHFSALTATNHSTKPHTTARRYQRGSYTMLPAESAVYYPEELSMLGNVLDQVVQSLPPDLRTPYNRVALAQNVLACASTGERDPDKLRLAALNSKLSVAA